MTLSSTETVYFMTKDHSIVGMGCDMGELYESDKDDDGFLYLTYASQETFG